MEEIISAEVRKDWNGSGTDFPLFLPVTDDMEKKENEERIGKSVELVKKQIHAFPYPLCFFGMRKRWKKKTERLVGNILKKEPLLHLEKSMSGASLQGFQDEIAAFMRRARLFAPELALADMGQAIRNYMVYAIFRELNGLPQKCTASIFGYSMLYPFTDNFIDGAERTKEEKVHYNQLIAGKLKGEYCQPVSEYEEKTLALLSAIEEDYDKSDEIYSGLLLMLEAQKNSQKQENTETVLTEEQAFHISVCKGGMSVLIDRYLIGKPMTEADLHFYYGFGFLLQLCDDLQDITQDRENGSRTLFTVCTACEETERKINRLLHYTKKLFEGCECRNEDFKQFLFDNCCLLILFSAAGSREHVSSEWLAEAQRHFPVSLKYMDCLQESLRGWDLDGDRKRYGTMMDTFLKA